MKGAIFMTKSILTENHGTINILEEEKYTYSEEFSDTYLTDHFSFSSSTECTTNNITEENTSNNISSLYGSQSMYEELLQSYPITKAYDSSTSNLTKLVYRNLNNRDVPIEEMKIQNIELANLYNATVYNFQGYIKDNYTKFSQNKSDNVYNCNSVLTLKQFLDFHNTTVVHQTLFCKDRLCPICSVIRSMKLTAQNIKIFNRLRETQPGIRYLFITLTQKNVPGELLSHEITRISKAFNSIFTLNNHKKKYRKLRNTLLGTIRVIEVTKNDKDNTYHAHIHAILAVKPGYFKGINYIKHEEYQSYWKEELDLDYLPQIRIQVPKPKNKSTKKTNIDDLIEMIKEVSKYCVKPLTIFKAIENRYLTLEEVEDFYYLVSSLYRRRLITFSGIFADIRKELRLTDSEDLEDLEDLQELEELEKYGHKLITYHFESGYGYVKKKEITFKPNEDNSNNTEGED